MVSEQKLLLVSFATHENIGYQNWTRAARAHGLAHRVVGIGQTWQGFMTKIRAYRDFCFQQKNNRDTVLAITDCYDVLSVATSTEILFKYRQFEAPIVFGAERFCWSDSCYPKQKATGDHRYLNSGCVIGHAEQLCAMYDWMIDQSNKVGGSQDDQMLMGHWASLHPTLCCHDTQSVLFPNSTD